LGLKKIKFDSEIVNDSSLMLALGRLDFKCRRLWQEKLPCLQTSRTGGPTMQRIHASAKATSLTVTGIVIGFAVATAVIASAAFG
ncbi:MAG: hypothetical protein RIG67_14700, partial [Rhodospirillales bacterium]